jgi:Domain of unknown function (DUF4189)
MNTKPIIASICLLAALIALVPLLGAADKDAYGAIAYSMKSKQYGTGAGDTKDEAKKNAMKFCKEKGKDCEIVTTDCTSDK